VSSTVLTLIVLPTLYNLVEGARERRRARRERATTPVVERASTPAVERAQRDETPRADADASTLPHAPQLTRRQLREKGE
jgi:HAE1 family hydrophobic/amphiphilic exporter-1